MSRLALAIVAAVAGVALVVAAARLNAQPRATFDCQSYAQFAGRIAEYRAVGAPLAQVLEFLRREYPPGLVLAAMERETKRVYAEGRTSGEAAWHAYRRCEAQLGEIGAES